VGRTPGPQPTPPSAGRVYKLLIWLLRQRDEGIPRRPGGLPHNFRRIPNIGKNKWH